MALESINPTSGEVLSTFAEFTPAQVEGAISAAEQAGRGWARTPLGERGRLLHGVADYLRAQQAGLARLITLEMGKPISEAEAEIAKCAWVCEFYSENGARFLADEPMPTNAAASYVSFPPLGVVLVI